MALTTSKLIQSAKQSFQQLSIRNAYFGAFASPFSPHFVPIETGSHAGESHDLPFPRHDYAIDGLNVLRLFGKRKLRLAVLLTVCRELLRHGRHITIHFDSHTERLFRKYRQQELACLRQLITDFGTWFKVCPREADADTHVMGEAERRGGIAVSEDTYTNPGWYVIRFPFIIQPNRRVGLQYRDGMLRIGSHAVPLCHDVPLLMREIATRLRCSPCHKPVAA